jgi:hypothetical protein
LSTKNTKYIEEINFIKNLYRVCNGAMAERLPPQAPEGIINFTEKTSANQKFFIHFTVFGRIKLTRSQEIIYNIFVHLKNRSVFI